jgi:hypothetical protein
MVVPETEKVETEDVEKVKMVNLMVEWVEMVDLLLLENRVFLHLVSMVAVLMVIKQMDILEVSK